MLSCWRSEPQARLSFTQLQYSFKGIVAASNTDTNYITVEANIKPTTASWSDPGWESRSQSLQQKAGYERIIRS